MCKNNEPTKYQQDAKINDNYNCIYYKEYKSDLSKTNW